MTARPARTDLPFPEALREVLAKRSTLPPDPTAGTAAARAERASLNALASRIGVGQSHLWRVVNRPSERRATLDLISKVSRALELPGDYFLETRADVVGQYLRAHPRRLNRLYTEAKRSSSTHTSPAS
jgi:transcriptional regulator with XRE-family HTH domain